MLARWVLCLTTAFAIVGCGDIPKEGDGSEKVQVKMELQYDKPSDNETPEKEISYLKY